MTSALSENIHAHGFKRKIGKTSVTANQQGDADIEKIPFQSTPWFVESSTGKRFKNIHQEPGMIGALATAPNSPFNGNKNPILAEDMALQEASRGDDITQVAYHESGERQTLTSCLRLQNLLVR
jgi:hypothetical protein